MGFVISCYAPVRPKIVVCLEIFALGIHLKFQTLGHFLWRAGVDDDVIAPQIDKLMHLRFKAGIQQDNNGHEAYDIIIARAYRLGNGVDEVTALARMHNQKIEHASSAGTQRPGSLQLDVITKADLLHNAGQAALPLFLICNRICVTIFEHVLVRPKVDQAGK